MFCLHALLPVRKLLTAMHSMTSLKLAPCNAQRKLSDMQTFCLCHGCTHSLNMQVRGYLLG